MIWMCWICSSRYLDFWLKESYSKWTCTVLFTGETCFICCYKVTMQSCRCIYLIAKMVVSYSIDMLNIINKVFWLWIECVDFIQNGVSLYFHNGTMILLLLQSYFENNFMYVDVYELLKKSNFPPFLML